MIVDLTGDSWISQGYPSAVLDIRNSFYPNWQILWGMRKMQSSGEKDSDVNVGFVLISFSSQHAIYTGHRPWGRTRITNAFCQIVFCHDIILWYISKVCHLCKDDKNAFDHKVHQKNLLPFIEGLPLMTNRKGLPNMRFPSWGEPSVYFWPHDGAAFCEWCQEKTMSAHLL